MKRIFTIILLSACSSAHAMDTNDQQAIVELHQQLNILITSGNKLITVHTLVDDHEVQLNQDKAEQLTINLLSTLRSLKQHDNGSITMIDCFPQTDSPPILPVKVSPQKTPTETKSMLEYIKPVAFFGAGALTAILLMKYYDSIGNE